MYRTLFAALLISSLSPIFAGPVSVPFVFEENTGQVDPQVRYFGRTRNAALWLTDSGAVLSIQHGHRRDVLRMNLDGASAHPRIDGAQPLAGRSNYLIANDPSHWRSDIRQYAGVRYVNAYPGIDLVFHASDQTIEYDWIVAPGGDPRRIRMSFEGTGKTTIDSSGDLVLRLGDEEVRQLRPHVFQERAQGRAEIDGRFVRRGRTIGFQISKYDRSRPLTIDPVLTYATYLGGSGNAPNQAGDGAYGVAADAQGNVVVVGVTASADFPLKNALYQDFSQVPLNGFIAKINPAGFAGASLIWSTYLGGNEDDTQPDAIALDSQGNVFATGITFATDFPILNAFQTSFSTAQTCKTSLNEAIKCGHAFVTKISSGGNQLLYSSFLGGTSFDNGNGIAVDNKGNAWIAGDTQSIDFPVRGNYVQSGKHGTQSGFVSEVSPDGSQLLYSTYLGGEKVDDLLGIALDSAGNAYVAGWSTSTMFPVKNAYQAALPSTIRAGVVAEINPSMVPSLLYSTYLGGMDAGGLLAAITTDGKGNIFVGGRSAATTFPVTANAVQTASALGPAGNTGTGAVVAELNPAAQPAAQLEYSTFLTGGFLDQVTSIALGQTGHIVVAGYTESPTFPTTSDAFQRDYSGVIADGTFSSKAFLSVIDPTTAGSKGLLYSTFYGGVFFESALGLALNAGGTTATIVGTATSTDLFVTPGAYQKGPYSQYGDAFIATFNLAQAGPVLSSMVNAASFANSFQFAPGEIVTFFGSNLGPSAITLAELDSTGHLGSTLAGCQLLVNGIAAPLVYVLATQVSAILPYELTPNIGKSTNNYAQMVCNNVAGNVLDFNAVAAHPAIFSATQTGKGQAAVLNQDGSYNSASNPAAAGSIVQIFATGEGVLTPAGQDGRIESGPLASIPVPSLPVSVTIGGTASPKLYYAGVAPGEVDGLLQVNAQVPSGLAAGNVPIVLNIGKFSSPQGLTIAVK